jgi:transcriptional regulator with XRE-family HTH domain
MLIRLGRSQARLSVQELADQARLDRDTLQKWEYGSRTPEDENAVRKLAKPLRLPEDLLLRAYQMQKAEGPLPLLPLDENQIIEEVNHYVRECAVSSETAEIWLVGAYSLPLLSPIPQTAALIRNAWIDNLSRGAEYHVAWALDQCDRARLEELLDVLQGIEFAVKDKTNHGRIHQYPLWLFWPLKPEQSQVDNPAYFYEQKQQSLIERPVISMYPIDRQATEDNEDWRNLQKNLEWFWQGISTTILLRPQQKQNPPKGYVPRPSAAILCLNAVRDARDGAPRPTFFWLDDASRRRLESLADSIAGWNWKRSQSQAK